MRGDDRSLAQFANVEYAAWADVGDVHQETDLMGLLDHLASIRREPRSRVCARPKAMRHGVVGRKMSQRDIAYAALKERLEAIQASLGVGGPWGAEGMDALEGEKRCELALACGSLDVSGWAAK